jgi:EAL domain-containing protein (putative c-di-GMP-specific phosphodiesterase class I)
MQLVTEIQHALDSDGFELLAQPITALSTSDGISRYEILLRMSDGDRGFVSTKAFFSAAERYRIMPQIDRWVVTATLAAIGSGEIKLPGNRSCTINLSTQTLGDEGFLEFVVESLDRSGVTPSSICFEVNEVAVSTDIQHVQRFIEVLHGIGCEFAIDDFGSGLGAFSSLKKLPVDYLKIDGAYTHNLVDDEINQEMITAMIKLARTMEFRIVAEQVEHQQDFDWLREVGVDFVQGNFIEKPAMLGSRRTSTFRTPGH